MKFLESKEISKEQGGVSIVFAPVGPINQSTLLGYQADLNRAIESDDTGLNVQIQMKTVAYALNEMIVSLTVDGEDYDPKQVASCANASDESTFKTLKTIYSITTDILLQGETKKKLSTQPKPIKKAKGVKNAQDQKAA